MDDAANLFLLVNLAWARKHLGFYLYVRLDSPFGITNH